MSFEWPDFGDEAIGLDEILVVRHKEPPKRQSLKELLESIPEETHEDEEG